MATRQKTVFVLGAGCTKAFLPSAPLLVDDYGGKALLGKFADFSYARRILELELGRNSDGRVDLEQLMTRLDGGMPYDFDQKSPEELGLLLLELKKSFKDRLEMARGDSSFTQDHQRDLATLAIFCIENKVPCITFNYDDVLDQSLWEVSQIIGTQASEKPWDPDGGYGFLCRPAEGITWNSASGVMRETSIPLLKLHGSINWYIRRGYSPPYSIDAIMHREEWCSSRGVPAHQREAVNRHLETEPFMIPPVLVKSALIEQPVLRLIWSLAFRELDEADHITFVGYSLPITDIGATFLFRETLLRKNPSPTINVVNFARTEEQKEEIRTAYRRIFPHLSDDQFEFGGAQAWAHDLLDLMSGNPLHKARNYLNMWIGKHNK